MMLFDQSKEKASSCRMPDLLSNGMRASGVLWGYGDQAELESAGADRLVAKTAELADVALAMVSAAER